MEKIEAIDAEQREQVIVASHGYIARAGELFDRDFDRIPVSFNLTGRAAGMYVVRQQQRLIRYNPYIFALYFEQNLSVTVPHEVAHYVTDEIYGNGRRRIKPHGEQWRHVMHELGADASRTFSFDITGVPVRAYKYYLYVCDCRQHQLGSRRHKRVLRRQARYHCRFCGGQLRQSA